MTEEIIDIKNDIINLGTEMEGLEARVDLCERVFGRIMQIDMRLDNLEFHSEATIKPAINEIIMDIKVRLANLEAMWGVENLPVENDD